MRKRPLVKKKLWIFDFDNTLARLEPEVDWAGGRRELEPMLRALGIPEDLFTQFPRGNLPLYSGMRARLMDLANDGSREFTRARVRSILRQASTTIEKYELAGTDRAAPLDGAIDLLHALKAGGSRIAIVTSNSSRTIRRWLTLHRLSRYVDAIVGRDSLLALKPSPEMIARALKRCDVRAKDSAFVGDADSDYLAAAALGMDFFGVAFRQDLRDKLAAAGAARIFSSPAALGIYLNLLDTAEIAPGDDAETRTPHRS
ncbi:MAG TPA: HAD family hydrolase [Candidatus Binataceae bacterium]|nr:HAD family hydrolase [Candidatus Binataceae bacterium]